MSTDVLVVAAFVPELAPLYPTLGDARAGTLGRARVVSRAVGIGLPMAAAGTAMHVGELQPRMVVAIGTCGAYAGSGLAIGEVVVSQRLRLVDPSVVRGGSQFPEPMSVVADASLSMAESIAASSGARLVDVATTLAITVDDEAAAAVARTTGAQVEHLEAHGMAIACAARGVPFAAVLAVANGVGSAARAEWRLHHKSAAGAAAAAVVAWLRSEGWSRLGREER